MDGWMKAGRRGERREGKGRSAVCLCECLRGGWMDYRFWTVWLPYGTQGKDIST